MSLPVILRPVASEEYDEAFDWYEGRQAGLGESFTAAAVQDVLDRIGATPRMHAVVYRGVRKAIVSTYPFCVYYRELDDGIEVISVFHTSRDPSEWRRRV